jgi:hypothetical protein
MEKPEMMKVTTSPAGSLSDKDWARWFFNLVRFFMPVLSIYLGFISSNLGDGFSWGDFIPDPFVAGTMSLYVINTLQDLITKYTSEKKYVNGDKV